jgi:uncharacterized protein
MTVRRFALAASFFGALFALRPSLRAQSNPPSARKHVLAWGDVHAGYQHDSISHAFATIERLGRESGLYDTWFRTDSQTITKHPVMFPAGTGIAANPVMEGNESFLVRNLNFFDAIFFFGVREVGLSGEQKADLMSFIKEDGKGFIGVHSGITAFFSWPEFGEMIGGRFDEHPWNVVDATVVVDDPAFPAMKGFPSPVVLNDEHYQLKDWSRDKVRVLAHLDPAHLDLKARLVHRADGDFPVAWAHTYGQGRVFYSTLGHADEAWDNSALQQMYFNALRWALKLVDGDATPLPRAVVTHSRGAAPAEAPGADTLPQGEGRSAVLKMCSDCHGLETAVAPKHTRIEWQALVELMRQQGAPGTDDDAALAVKYLSEVRRKP